MRIYVIRHGETKSNEERIRQSRDGYLSEDGIQEARALAEKLRGITIDSIFTSSYPRAKQTADIISALGVKHFPVQESEFLTEIKLPSEVVGRPVDDPVSKRILSWLKRNTGSPFRYSDEETFNEYVSRANKVLDYISKTKFENSVVVTHHRFIHTLIAVVLLGKQLSPGLFATVRDHLYISNTGVTILEKNPLEGDWWRVLTVNEHSHLEQLRG